MAGDVSGKFYYSRFCNNYAVIFNVLLNFKLKLYRFYHSLIALKWKYRQEKKHGDKGNCKR